MKVSKLCEKCGVQYSIRRDRAERSRFCSKVCEVASTHTEKACRRCGEKFHVKPSQADKLHYCSAECRVLHGSASKNCLHCGNAYMVKASHAERSVFCSKECMTAHHNVVKVCACCGSSFTIPKRRNEQIRFCSTECREQSRRPTANCRKCGKPFSYPAHQKRVYCSAECSHFNEHTPRGENHYRWVGDSYVTAKGYVGLSRSMTKSPLKLQHRQVIEDAMTAQVPTHPFLVEVDGKLQLRREIHVHHIDRVRSNNELSNLLALTPSAHLLLHRTNRKPDPWECWPPNPERW